VNCPDCGNANPPGEAFCEYCGRALSEQADSRKTHLDRGGAPASPDPSKRRTVYEPKAAASPAAPSASRSPVDDPFAAPPPRRVVHDPVDPFRAALQGPPPAPAAAPTNAPRRGTQIDRSGAPVRRVGAVLVAFARADDAGTVFALRHGRNTVGRDEANDVRLDDGRVSGQHGFVFVRDDGASFIDVSTNGSIVDGRAVLGQQVDLAHGSWLRLGGTCLVFASLPVLPAQAWDEA
jgi:pSer/pThr/pTyr-binding forkhead associated (FHA) protein